MKSGNLKFLEPSGPLQACNGTALPLYGSSDNCIQPDDGLIRNGRNMYVIRCVHYNTVVFLTAILCILVCCVILAEDYVIK